MKRPKKALGLLAVIGIAIATALLATWLSAIMEEEPDIFGLSEAETGQGRPERQIDWDSLPESVIAWVEVPGTSIDGPVVQASKDAPNDYLYVDALGQGAYGTPYIDCDCTLDSRFVMIYGHHMSDGSVFANFASFIDEAYAREHAEIILYQREGPTFHLTPIAVDVVNASREILVINQEADFKERLSSCDLVLSDASEDNQLFAFVTCSYQTKNSRTILYAGAR